MKTDLIEKVRSHWVAQGAEDMGVLPASRTIDRMLKDGFLETVIEEGWAYFHVGASEKRASVGSSVGAGEI